MICRLFKEYRRLPEIGGDLSGVSVGILSADGMTDLQHLFRFLTGFSFCRKIRAGERSIVLA